MTFAEDRELILSNLSIGKELLYLTKDDCENIGITRDSILELTRDALISHGKKEYEMPAKIGVHPLEEVFYHAMPAFVPSKKAVGMKWIECYPNNPMKFNLPQTTGLLILNDILSGCPIAIMDSTWITAMRTPAVTALAAEAIHPHAKSFGMFGCGVQGIEHILFIVKTLKDLEVIYIYDIVEEAMDNLIEKVKDEVNVLIVKAKNPKEVVDNCECLSSATIIIKDTLSIVKDEWIKPGQTILPCDLNTFWDPKISHRADYYIVDSMDEHKLFNSMGYFPDGLPTIKGETGEILAGLKNIKADDNSIIVCSNIGMAVCDVVVGREIFDQAIEKKIGIKLVL